MDRLLACDYDNILTAIRRQRENKYFNVAFDCIQDAISFLNSKNQEVPWTLYWELALIAKEQGDIRLVDEACNAVLRSNPGFWFARELPKHARGYYSQLGQDEIIEKFFQAYPPKSKVFVEVGAFDGVHYSNVRRLQEVYGWTGISIEPVATNFDKLSRSYEGRPVVCVRCAAGKEEGIAELNVSSYPHLPDWGSDVATFSESETHRWQQKYGAVWHKEHVPVKKLTTILRENKASAIDFLSVDAEGHDLDVLKGLDFSLYQPQMIVVEYNKHREEILEFLAECGYQLFKDNGQDLFLTLSPVENIPLCKVASLIHPHLLENKFLENATFEKELIRADRLLNSSRFDIPAKLAFARFERDLIDSVFGKELYYNHLAVFNGFREAGDKSRFEDFVRAFRATLQSIEKIGFSPQISLIPIDMSDTIIDGAHRVAACICYDHPIQVLRCDRPAPIYNYEWFRTKGLCEDCCDAIAQEYIRWSPNCLTVTLFPAAPRERDDEAIRLLKTQGDVVYGRELLVRGDGPALLIWQMYRDEPWIGEAANVWVGSRNKASCCFPTGEGVVRVFLYEPKPGVDLRQLKEAIRAVYCIGNHSIHINDTHIETAMLGGIYFNANSRHFLNNAKMRHLTRFWSFFTRFCAGLRRQDADSDRFCIDGSAILSAYGLRDCRDIDFLHTGPDEYTFGNPALIGSHNLCVAHHVTSLDDIIWNPANHFYFHGIRFSSLGILMEMKRRRGEGKDIVDVALIASLEEAPPAPHRQANSVTKPFNWQDRPTKIVGLLAVRNDNGVVAETMQALAPFVDAIVLLDDASTDTTLAVCEANAVSCKVEHIIRKATDYRDHIEDLARLLNVGRFIGGTHFIVLRVGEYLTPNLHANSFLRKALAELEPGDILMVLDLRQQSGASHMAVAFKDNWSCYYGEDFSHNSPLPDGLSGNTVKVNDQEAGVRCLNTTKAAHDIDESLNEIRTNLDQIFSFNQPKAFNNVTHRIISNPYAKLLFSNQLKLLAEQECVADFIPRDGLSHRVTQQLMSTACRIGYLGASVTAQNDSYVTPLHQLIQKITRQKHQQIVCAYGAMGCLAALQKIGLELFASQPTICFIDLLTGDLNDGLTPLDEIGPALEAIVKLARESCCEPIFLNLFRADHLFNFSNPWLARYESVALHYGAPSFNICSTIFKGLCCGKFSLEAVLKDAVHTTPQGSQLVASLASTHFEALLKDCKNVGRELPESLYPPRYLRTKSQFLQGAPHHAFKSQPVWFINVPGGELSFNGQGYLAGLQLVVGPRSGILEIEISSIGYSQQFSTWDHWCYHGERFYFLPVGVNVPPETTVTLRSLVHERTWCGFCYQKSADGTLQPRSHMPGWDSLLPRENPCSERNVSAPHEPLIQIVSALWGIGGEMTAKASEADRGTAGKDNKKIVALVPARNEQHIIAQCLKGLSYFADAIVYLDDASTDNTLDIVAALADECRVEHIISKKEWLRDEPGDRNRMLAAGREIGGTHFIIIDADEMFSSNLANNNGLVAAILMLQPGDRLALNWIQLWRSIDEYRFDNSVWTWNYKEIIFCDDGRCSYSSEFIHTPRVPTNLNGRSYKLEGYEAGLLHFQFVNWRNLMIKQAWYRCLEHIRDSRKSVQEINSRYAPSKDESGLGHRPSPLNWFDGYPFFDRSIYDRPDEWREKQILDWFRQYGIDYFADLDIWDIDWPMSQGTAAESIVEPDNIIRSNIKFWQQIQDDNYFERQNQYLIESYGQEKYLTLYKNADPVKLRENFDQDTKILNAFTQLKPDMTVVVIGCGYGRETLAIAPSVKHVYGIDVSHTILNKAARFLAEHGIHNFTPVLAEEWKDRVPCGIDLVYSITVFQHITRDLVKDYVVGLASKLSTNGKFICQFAELEYGTEDADLRCYQPAVTWTKQQIYDLIATHEMTAFFIGDLSVPNHGVWHWAFFGKSSAPRTGTWTDRAIELRSLEGGLSEIQGVKGYLNKGDITFLANRAQALQPNGIIVEIASFAGLSALVMASALNRLGREDFSIYCVDTWMPNSTSSTYAAKFGHLEDMYAAFQLSISLSGLSRFIIPIRLSSPEAASHFADNSIDLLFLNGDHSFDGCYCDLLSWYPKVKLEGIVLGYDCTPHAGVREAVNKFVNEHSGLTVHILPDTHYMYEISRGVCNDA